MSLNSSKIHFIKLCINQNTLCFLKIGYGIATSVEAETTNFLGLQIDGNFNWKTHRVYFPSMNFCMPCNRDSHTNHEKRKPKISLFCLQAVMLNGMIFWQTSAVTKKGFCNQKKNKYNNSWHQKEISKKFNFLPLASKYVLSLLSMGVEKMEKM